MLSNERSSHWSTGKTLFFQIELLDGTGHVVYGKGFMGSIQLEETLVVSFYSLQAKWAFVIKVFQTKNEDVGEKMFIFFIHFLCRYK